MGSCAPTLLGEHQGVFPPRLGDDGAVFHLTIPRARAGWAGGRAGGRPGARAGWGAWAGARRAPAPETPTPTAAHIPPPPAFPPRVGKGGGLHRGRTAQAAGPRCPQPRSPGGSSGLLSLGPTWRIRSENKRRKWDTGRFPGSPLPSVLQINNPRLQRPPPRSSLLLNRRLHGLPARPAPGQRPRPRDPPPASDRGCGPGRGLLFC